MNVTCLSKFRTFLVLDFRASNVKKFHTCSKFLLKNNFSSETVKPLSSNVIKNKFNELVTWYEQVTGMDEVREIQNKVIEAQDKFVQAQEKRREASKALSLVQSKLKDIYSELDTTSRGEERYLQLITQEHAVLKEEKKLQAEFALSEREERETFTLLSNYVKESHEKERAQAERTKYWSVIGSVIGTIIGILGTSINNQFKMKELRNLVKETSLSNKNDPTTGTLLLKHEQELSSLVTDMKSIVRNYIEKREFDHDSNVVGRLDQLLHTVSKNSNNGMSSSFINESIQRLNDNVQDLKGMLRTAQSCDGQLITLPANLDSLLEAQKQETRVLLIGLTAVAFVIPIIVTYVQRFI